MQQQSVAAAEAFFLRAREKAARHAGGMQTA